MSKNYFKKFSISILAVSALTFGALHNDASASFWDWFKIGGNSEQTPQTQQATAVVNAETIYKWVNNGLVKKSEGRNTGVCGAKTLVETSTCDSSKVGNKVYDGTDRGSSYGDTGHAWPVYEGQDTSTATEYTYNTDSCTLHTRTGGTVNEWECKLSDSTTASSSSSSNTTTSSSSSSGYQFSTNLKVVTNSATSVTSNSATLNGTINPKDENVVFMFYYVKSGQPDTQKMTSWKSVISGSSDVSVSANVTNLSSDTTYRFAVIAYSYTSKKFTRIGGVQSFTTSESSTTGSSSSSSSVEQYTVNVKKTGFGTVKSNQKGTDGNIIKCGSNCSGTFYENKDVILEAYPDSGKKFVGWSGGKCDNGGGSKKTCGLKMKGDKKIMADFETGKDDDTNEQPLLIVLSGSGSGSVSDNNGEIRCGNDCIGKYHTQTIILTAKTSADSKFAGWEGSCDGGNKTCSVKMDEKETNAKKVTAIFDLKNKISSSSSSSKSSLSSKSSSSSSSSSASIPWATNITARTESATNAASNSATLNGTVNPRGENVVYRFNYVKVGQKDTLKTTSWTSAGTGSDDISVKADISGLSSETIYNYAIQAYSYTSKKFTLVGVDYSGVKSFTTSGSSSNSFNSSSSSSQTTASAYKLKITIQGSGKVQDNYSKISCGSNTTCQATYSKGQVITLKTEDSDSDGKSFGTKVDSWSGGGCSGTSNVCFITIDGEKEITIKFVSK